MERGQTDGKGTFYFSVFFGRPLVTDGPQISTVSPFVFAYGSSSLSLAFWNDVEIDQWFSVAFGLVSMNFSAAACNELIRVSKTVAKVGWPQVGIALHHFDGVEPDPPQFMIQKFRRA